MPSGRLWATEKVVFSGWEEGDRQTFRENTLKQMVMGVFY